MADREEVLAELDAARMCNQIEYAAYSRLHDLISEIPEQKFFVDSNGKITPLPVQKHGHWIKSPRFLPETQCSVCKKTYVGDCRTFKFCPDCGTRMDEEVKQDGET